MTVSQIFLGGGNINWDLECVSKYVCMHFVQKCFVQETINCVDCKANELQIMPVCSFFSCVLLLLWSWMGSQNLEKKTNPRKDSELSELSDEAKVQDNSKTRTPAGVDDAAQSTTRIVRITAHIVTSCSLKMEIWLPTITKANSMCASWSQVWCWSPCVSYPYVVVSAKGWRRAHWRSSGAEG